jgi:phosphatidylserine/phosphatidylglycerophosphate/cardiolipin synthase-like enzyme
MSLARAGIPLFLFDGTRFNPLMHNKFLVFKNVPKVGDVVVSGSMNFTQSGLFNNAENLTIRNKTEIVTQFANQFRNLIKQCEQLTLCPVQPKRKRKRQEHQDQQEPYDIPEHIAKKLATGKMARYVTQIKK